MQLRIPVAHRESATPTAVIATGILPEMNAATASPRITNVTTTGSMALRLAAAIQ